MVRAMLFFATIVAYLGALLGVAVWKSRTTRTQEQFMVAGRSVSAWFLAGTLVCTWIGSGSLFGGAGLAFREGVSMLWMSAGAWVGIVSRRRPCVSLQQRMLISRRESATGSFSVICMIG